MLAGILLNECAVPQKIVYRLEIDAMLNQIRLMLTCIPFVLHNLIVSTEPLAK